MNKSSKKTFVAALRSGDYKQTCRLLHDGEKFCAIGVLMDSCLDGYWVAGNHGWHIMFGKDRARWVLTSRMLRSIGISPIEACAIIRMNDVVRMSFKEIADVVEGF